MRSEIAEHVHELEQEHLPFILEELEDLKAVQIPLAPAHGEIDRSTIEVDYDYTLRHFVSISQDASGPSTPATASLRVSSFLETATTDQSSKYETAPTHFSAARDSLSVCKPCTQVFVRGIPTFKTLIFQTTPRLKVFDLKELVRDRIEVPNAIFDFAIAGRVLQGSCTLEEGNISHDSTLICLSFRSNSLRCRPNTTDFEAIDFKAHSLKPSRTETSGYRIENAVESPLMRKTMWIRVAVRAGNKTSLGRVAYIQVHSDPPIGKMMLWMMVDCRDIEVTSKIPMRFLQEKIAKVAGGLVELRLYAPPALDSLTPSTLYLKDGGCISNQNLEKIVATQGFTPIKSHEESQIR